MIERTSGHTAGITYHTIQYQVRYDSRPWVLCPPEGYNKRRLSGEAGTETCAQYIPANLGVRTIHPARVSAKQGLIDLRTLKTRRS